MPMALNLMAAPRLLINSRLMAALFLGFASGLPIMLTGSTLQAWFTEANIDLVTIGALSFLGIPYTLKFLWAPVMDYYRIPFLGRRRGWILLMQVCIALILLVLANMQPSSQAARMGTLALLLAFFSASQDIAIDAYRTDMLHKEERGLGAAYFIFAYRMAVLFSGGFALIFADYLGWRLTFELMALSMALSIIPTLRAPAVPEIKPEISNTFLSATVESVRELLARDQIVLVLFFVIFYKLGDAFAFQLMTPFLLHGLGFSLSEVGFAYKMVSFVGVIGGGFVAGYLLVRWNIYRALLIFGIMQSFSNLLFVVLAYTGKNFFLMMLSIFIENFCGGLSTAAFFAFLMSICNQRYTATQYALLSAFASFGRVFLGPVAAVLVKELGWVQFYMWSFVCCLPGIWFLILLKEKVLISAHANVN